MVPMGQANVPPAEQSHSATATSTTDRVPKGFWDSFTVFRWSYERSVTQRWYLVGLIYLILVLGTAFLRDLAVGKEFSQDPWIFFKGDNFRYATLHYELVSRWGDQAIVLGLLLTVGLVDRWQRSIPPVFQYLERRHELITPQPEAARAFQSALAGYQDTLLHGKGAILTRPVITGIVAVGAGMALLISFANTTLFTLAQVAATASPLVVLIQGIGKLVVEVVTPLLFLSLLVSFLWIMGATGLALRRLIYRFSLHHRLAPATSDDGSAMLGHFARTLALVVLASVVLLGGSCLWYGFSIWSVGAGLLLLLLILFLTRTCFAPVYAVRQRMLKGQPDVSASS
jgi:hypothetical protein